MSESRYWRNFRGITAASVILLLFAGPLFVSGCGGQPGTTTDTDGSQGSATEPTSYKGIMSGSVSDSRSTRESIDIAEGETAGQALPPDINPTLVTIAFEDLNGDPLLDAAGEPYPPGSVDQTGAFTAEGFPVGINFVVAVDLDGDGEPDIEQIVQIPADDTGEAGSLDDVMVDPLTTLIVAKLRDLLIEHGIDPDELDISPTAIVHRIVDAFIHLFEESGIDQDVNIEDIADLAAGDVDDLFESFIPPAVRAGINTVEGNLALATASQLEDAISAAAEVFLRAGFPIADDPGGIVLSFLGDLPDVTVESIDIVAPPDDLVIAVAQLDETYFDDGTLEDLLGDGTLEDLLGDGTLEDLLGEEGFDEELLDQLMDEFPDGFPDTLPETVFPFDPDFEGERPVVYVSTVTEPDRNFIANDELDPEAGRHPLPILNERLIERIARLHLEGRVITLRGLYRLLTDEEIGLGARVTFMVPTPGHEGPPPMVFESADGRGVARDIERTIFELLDSGFADPGADFDELHSHVDSIREKMLELLEGTVPPSIHRLFGAILSERIESVDQLFSFIRKARAHLPFNRSGSSTFFVVSDGDQWRPDAGEVHPVSMDVEFGPDGFPTHVVYNPTHTGPYYLAFTHGTETDYRVELLVRETGRWLHGPHGEPIFLNMNDETLFDPVDGKAFVEFVSEAGTFWPGVPVAVSNPEHRLDNESDGGGMNGPTMQLYVLATDPGLDAEPVRVNYDIGTGTFSSDPNGRYYLMFLPETQMEGVFGLYDIDLNFMASVNDLSGSFFVEGPPPPPADEPTPPGDEFPPPEDEFPPPPEDEFPPPADEPPPDSGDEPPADLEPAATGDEPAADPEPPATTDEPPADTEPPATTDQPPPDDEFVPPPDEGFPPPDEGFPPPNEGPIPVFEPARVIPPEVIGLDIQPEFFTFVYGTEVSNENYDPSGNPYFDDINGNGVEDPGEFTTDFRPILFNPDDWRSTYVGRYYRTNSGGGVIIEEVDFESPEPRTFSGETLVPRNFLPRLNAFTFGRPNSAINLLTTFLPPEFFDGTHSLSEDTPLGIFQAIATVNLVMEQVFNAEAIIDIDGDGPFEPQPMLIDAHLFVLPIGDPFVLVLDAFEQLSEAPGQGPTNAGQ